MVLKTTAAQDDTPIAVPAGHFNDRLGQSIVKPGGYFTDRNTGFYVAQNRLYHLRPINDEGRLMCDQRQVIAFVGFDSVEGKFQLHCRLSFKIHLLSKINQRRNRIKQPADA